MKILAVEFSSEERSVAVVQADGEAGPTVLARAVETNVHRALGLVEEALRQAGCEREDIETLAIGLGPGSYTGIRGAIALAQGWQLGRGVNSLGLSSVECLATAAELEKFFGVLNIVVDAQRNEFYLARYEIGPGASRAMESLRLATMSEVEELARRGERIIGPGSTQWFPSAQNQYPDAAILGCLASARREFVPAEKLEPIYLRETAFKKAPPARAMKSMERNSVMPPT